ncbi:MAG: 30S ribosomal protein S18 [Chloroflexi bacterium]|nr:30S ribosomal protein S18 [Chloroflexota bacterium]
MRFSSPPGGSREGSSEGGRGGDRDQRRGGRFGGRRLPRVCPFCKAKVDAVDYKDADMLRRYLSERGKIKPRRKIGTCARHQRRLSVAVKRARQIALLPFAGPAPRSE